MIEIKNYPFHLTEHAVSRFIMRYRKMFHKKIPEDFANLLFLSMIEGVRIKRIMLEEAEDNLDLLIFTFCHFDEGKKNSLVLVTLLDEENQRYIVKTIMSLDMYKKKRKKRPPISKVSYNRAKAKRESREEILSAVGF